MINKMNLQEDNTNSIISLNRNEISKNVQWLVSLGGTIEMIEKIIEIFSTPNQTILINTHKSPELLNLKSTMLYISNNNDSGHWIYYNSNGTIYNSYDLDHQPYGSAQFCQTYAMLYMLGENSPIIKRKFTNKLKSGSSNYANNIKVVVKFWRYIFRYDKLLRQWMISEVKSINNYDVINNYSFITRNSIEINLKLIKKLLTYIYNTSEQIANLC
jgi:hypothetical protein